MIWRFFIIVFCGSTLLWILIRYIYSYWTRKGFPALAPRIPLGCLGPLVKQKQSFGEVIRDIYLQSGEPYLGLYFLFRPVLLIRDPELVKRILITDFDYFADRGMHYDEENDPIGANLFVMPNDKWRLLRKKLTPAFSSVKLKSMFPVIEKNTMRLKTHLERACRTEDVIHLKDYVSKSIISQVAGNFFGFELDAFEEPEHEFVMLGDRFFDSESLRSRLILTSWFLTPELLKWFRMSVLSPTVSEYMLSLVKTVMEMRKNDPSIVRNDFIQSLLELMKESEKNDEDSLKLTVEMCAATSMLFYIAGYPYEPFRIYLAQAEQKYCCKFFKI